MLSRLWTNLVILVSLATLAAVAFFFVREYQRVQNRDEVLAKLKQISAQEGPCAGLAVARELARPLDAQVERAVRMRREQFAAEIVGEADKRGQSALLSADADGLVDRTLCEQIKLVLDLGQAHPVLEFFRYTREGGDPCQDPEGVDHVLDNLSSHRPLMLRALMQDVSRLRCIPPWLAARIADLVIEELRADSTALDDLDVLRIAKFLETWAPVHTAQLGCLAEADGHTSRLAGAIGCTPYHERHVLPRYRFADAFPSVGGEQELAAGNEVLLLDEEGDRCRVRPVQEPPRVALVPCDRLTMLSDVHVAVHIESVRFGLAQAALVAGVAVYDGAAGELSRPGDEPEVRSWYGYDPTGGALGMTHAVRLSDLAAKFGEDVPANPLRAFCHEAGARYCYDVDWAEVVGTLQGEPKVFLSRPMRVFLQPVHLPSDVAGAEFREAFGRGPRPEAMQRYYQLARGGLLIVETVPSSVELRWRLGAEGTWYGAAYGTPEGGTPPPAARLLAAMDLEGDGRPELLLQRFERRMENGEVAPSLDQVLALVLDPSGQSWHAFNRLTVHEY